MKKILAILLCLAMALTMSIPAFAITELDKSPATDNDEGDYGIGIDGKFNPAEEPALKISVDIIWEKMEFTYTGGEKSGWDAEHHTYASTGEGSWSENKPAITVKNHSEADINAAFEFSPADGVETVGTFYAKDSADYTALNADEQAISLDSAIGTVRSEDEDTDETPTGVIYFGVSGASVSEDTRLGSIVVTITAIPIVYTVVNDADALYEAMKNGGYIRLGNNIDLGTDGSIYISYVDDDIVLDLNGFAITGTVALQSGNLTVKDRIGTGVIYSADNCAVGVSNGTLSIEGGTFTSGYYAVVFVESGYLNISGGTFNGTVDCEYTNAEISGGTFYGGYTYSLTNTAGTVNISDGTFFASVGNAGNMTITGGIIDCSDGYVTENYGTLTISGGIVMGILENTSSGTITVTGGAFDTDPSDYVDFSEYTVTVSDGIYTVDVNESGEVTANTAGMLKNMLEAGGDVKLGSSFELTEDFDISADVTRTLDLNGYTLTGTIYLKGGTLTVKDSVGTGKMESTESDRKVLRVSDNATLNIESGTFGGISADKADVNISDGIFIGYDTLDIFDGAKLIVTGGTVTAENDALYVSGEAEISGGSFTGAVRASDDGTLTIKGGTFSADPTAYVDTDGYDVTESDGKYTVTAKAGE